MDAAVHRRDRRQTLPAHGREVNVIAMKVDRVELRGVAKHHLHQPNVMRERLADVRIVPECHRARWDQASRCLCVAAGKKRDIVA